MFKNGLCQILIVGPWQNRVTWTLRLRVVKMAGSDPVVHLMAPPILGRRGVGGDGIPDMLLYRISSTSSLYVVQVGTLSQCLEQWRSITSIGLCIM